MIGDYRLIGPSDTVLCRIYLFIATIFSQVTLIFLHVKAFGRPLQLIALCQRFAFIRRLRNSWARRALGPNSQRDLQSSKMEEDKKFKKNHELEDWLKTRGVDDEKASTAAGNLHTAGYDQPSTLIDIGSDALRRGGLPDPLAQHISNKLKVQKVSLFFFFLSSKVNQIGSLLNWLGF